MPIKSLILIIVSVIFVFVMFSSVARHRIYSRVLTEDEVDVLLRDTATTFDDDDVKDFDSNDDDMNGVHTDTTVTEQKPSTTAKVDKYVSQDPIHEDDGDPYTIVYLIAHGRSGSTMAESILLGTNTDIFFIDEPLIGHHTVDDTSRLLETAFTMLDSCSLESFYDYETLSLAKWERQRMHAVYGKGTNVLEKADFWSWATEEETSDDKNKEAARIHAMYQEKCSQKRVRGMKSIRLQAGTKLDHDPLLDMLLAKNEHVRVLHLIRHPHEVQDSGKSVGMEVCADIEKCCLGTLTDMEAAEPYLDSRYKIIKYQDISTQPYEVVVDVHRWLGLSVQEELINSTIAQHFKSEEEIHGHQKAESNKFSTIREVRSCKPCDAEVNRTLTTSCQTLVDAIHLECCS